MSYELTGKQKELEFDMFWDALDNSTIRQSDFDFDDKINKRNFNNHYDGDFKFNEVLGRVVKKLELLKIQHVVNKIATEHKVEDNRYTTYTYKTYDYDFYFYDKSFQFSFDHLTYEERALCSLEIVFLLFMHHIKVDAEVLTRIFGQEVSRYTFMSMRKAIEKISNHKLVKNKNGNYHFEKVKGETNDN